MATGQGGLIGSGMVPGGAIGNELSAVTRRAFIPELIVQIYQASPVLYMLMRGAQRAAGGADATGAARVSARDVPGSDGTAFRARSGHGLWQVFG